MFWRLSQKKYKRSGAGRSRQRLAARTKKSDARGEALAQETLQRAATHFGRALSLLVNILDPEVIVLGGGVSNLPVFYERGVDELRRWVFSDGLRTRVVRHELGDSAGVLGAAYLADPAE